MVQLENFKILLDKNEYDDEYLYSFLNKARDMILMYTNRKSCEWLDLFDSVQLQLALSLFNQSGNEGTQSQRIGSVSTVFADLKKSIAPLLDPYRVVKSY